MFRSEKISAVKFSQKQSCAKSISIFFFSKLKLHVKFGKALDAGKLRENIEVTLQLSDLKALHASWVVKFYNLPALDPFQEIDPIESYVCFEEHQRYLSADREYAECFFVGNHLEEEKGKGTFDEIYHIKSVKEGNQDQDGNAFEDEKSEDDM